MYLDLTDPETRQRAKEVFSGLDFSPGGRGFLTNYPGDVISVVNGKPITIGDVLREKHQRQSLQLRHKRKIDSPLEYPCFVWVFYNDPKDCDFFMGHWLYVKSLRQDWAIGFRSRHLLKFRLPIMRLFPCGYLPMIENFEPWLRTFAATYHYPTAKRPTGQGMAMARVVVSQAGDLLEVKELK